MKHVKYLILGAGPAGLTLARCLKDKGEDSILVLEKENEAGGLCRSQIVDNSPLDIGGGHFLDVRRPKVVEFLFKYMPEDEWNVFERDSQISINDQYINHPFEANIWQMDTERQLDYLVSISEAGCNRGIPKPQEFTKWIEWKLGKKIAEDYMLPYNSKMFANDLDQLGTYWLEKLPDVSFRDTLRSCLDHKAYGKQPGHASFYYPKKYGYGEVWLRIAESMNENIIYNVAAQKLDLDKKEICCSDGIVISADKIVTTIPWTSFDEIQGLPEELTKKIPELKHSSIEVRYVSENMDTKAHWIYYPQPDIPYHRILVRHNFCPNSKGYWLETRKERIDQNPESSFAYMNDYAYPLNTIGKPELVKDILDKAKTKEVYGLGRWGEHSHYNSDLVVELAMNMSGNI